MTCKYLLLLTYNIFVYRHSRFLQIKTSFKISSVHSNVIVYFNCLNSYSAKKKVFDRWWQISISSNPSQKETSSYHPKSNESWSPSFTALNRAASLFTADYTYHKSKEETECIMWSTSKDFPYTTAFWEYVLRLVTWEQKCLTEKR